MFPKMPIYYIKWLKMAIHERLLILLVKVALCIVHEFLLMHDARGKKPPPCIVHDKVNSCTTQGGGFTIEKSRLKNS